MADNQTIRVLLVEDDEDDYILVRDMLGDVDGTRYELFWANSSEDGLEALRSSRCDVCLLDYHLREQSGIGFLHALAGQDHVPPIIFLTGMANYTVDLEAMRAGAADYLEKDQVNAPILERAIRYAIERQANQARLKQQRAILEGINRILREALTCETEEELGRTSVAVVQELTGAGCGFIQELQPDGRLQTIARGKAVAGACGSATQAQPTTPDRPDIRDLCSRALRQGSPLLTNDPELCRDSRMTTDSPTSLRSFLGIPWQHGDKVMGIIGLVNKNGGFKPADQQVAEALAPAVVEALMHFRAEEALRESEEELRSLNLKLMTAQETERKRISMELHDDLGQSLAFLKLQMRYIENKLPPELQELKQCVTDLREYLNEVIEKVRRISQDLSPAILTNLGLPMALANLVEDFCKFHDCHLSMELDKIKDVFLPEEEISIYRIFQESLNNIAKHAQADHVRIITKRNGGYLKFLVEDNGRGFDVHYLENNEGGRQGLGLASIKERMRVLGGDFEIWSQPGQGTRLSFLIPLRKNKLASPGQLPL